MITNNRSSLNTIRKKQMFKHNTSATAPSWFPVKSLSLNGLFSRKNNKNNVISSQRLQQECKNKSINIEELREQWLCIFEAQVKSKPENPYELIAGIFLIIRYLDNPNDDCLPQKTQPRIKGLHQDLLIDGIIAMLKGQYKKEAKLFDKTFVINLLIIFAHIETPKWKTTFFGMTPPPPASHDDLTPSETIFISYLVNQLSATHVPENIDIATDIENDLVKSDTYRKLAITAMKESKNYLKSINTLFMGKYQDSQWLHGLFNPRAIEVEPSDDHLLEKRAPLHTKVEPSAPFEEEPSPPAYSEYNEANDPYAYSDSDPYKDKLGTNLISIRS